LHNLESLIVFEKLKMGWRVRRWLIGGAVTTSVISYFAFRDQVWDFCVKALVNKTRSTIKHELAKETTINSSTRGLTNVTIKHVLQNPKVVAKTGQLVHSLFEKERTRRIMADLGVKAMKMPVSLATVSKGCQDRVAVFLVDDMINE
jgi:hypothetical protein